MKKHILAAAVATAVAVPALAQNVSIGGVIDISPYSSSRATEAAAGSPTSDRSGTQGGANRAGGWTTSNLAFSGTEDLGGGLRASFFFNQELRQTDGTVQARDLWLALAGPMGEIKIGRQPTAIEAGWGAIASSGTTNTAGTADSTGYDLIAGTLGITQTRAQQFPAAGVAQGTTAGGSLARQSGVIRYTSPAFSGVTVSLDYIDNSTDDSTVAGESKNKQIGGTATYVTGPLSLVFGYAKRDATGALPGTGENVVAGETATTGKATLSYYGGSYDFGIATVRYAYGMREDNTQANPSVVQSDLSVHNVGITIPVGAVTLAGNMYDGNDDRTIAAADERKLSGYQLSARYALSKRTAVYAVTGNNRNEGTGVDNTAKVKTSTVGVTHSF